MRGRAETIIISLAYAAGNAAAVAFGQRFNMAEVMAPAVVLSYFAFLRSDVFLPVLFFSAGAFIAAVRGMMDMDLLFIPRQFACSKADLLRYFIYSIPWSHEDTGPLLNALLSGDRSGLSQKVISDFRTSGGSHILALSGLHLGVIYGIFKTVGKAFGKSPLMKAFKACAIIVLCTFFTLMTGAAPSLVRALLFIVLRELSLLNPQRHPDIVRTLFLALMIQLTVTPEVITQLGFQLSYLAMSGIALIYPRLRDMYPEGKGPVKKMWESLSLSISCQITTAPLVWLRFGTFPQMFLLTNFLSLPLCALLIPVAVGTVCVQTIAPSVNGPLIALTDILARGMIYTMEKIAGLTPK